MGQGGDARTNNSSLSVAPGERRFAKKFEAGRKYIFTEVFPWLSPETPLRQYCVLVRHPRNRSSLAGGTIISIDELMRCIKDEISQSGIMAKSAVPEQYRLLRTVQLTVSGYYGLA